MSAVSISKRVLKDGRFGEALDASAQLKPVSPESSDISETSLVNAVVGRWVNAALNACEKVGAIAADAGVSEQFFTQIRQGKKAPSMKVLMAILQDRAAFMAFFDAAAVELGHDLAPCRGRRKVRKDEAEKAVARQAKQLGLVWRAMREAVAADLGTSTDDLEAALESESA